MLPDDCAIVTTRRSCVREIETGAMVFATIRRGLLNVVTGKGSPIGLALPESKRIPHTLKKPSRSERK
jgi:hypothetical protein